jgi:hypothetical protein
VDDLLKIPMDRLVAALHSMKGPSPFDPIGPGPVVDGRSLPRNPFDPDAPALTADVPMLIGTTAALLASWRAIHFSPSTGRQRHPNHCSYQRSQRRKHLFAGVRQPDAGARLGICDSARGQADARSYRQPDKCVSPAMPWPLQIDAPDVLPGERLLAGRRVDRQ